MNITEIKEKFPKALEEFKLWMYTKTNIILFAEMMCRDVNFNHFRILYDFFGDQLIYPDVIHIGEGFFTWNISDKIGISVENFDTVENIYTNLKKLRSEAEIEAFIKAFEILEDRL